MNINWEALTQPFHPDDIDWRIQSAGKDNDGKIWARCVCYVTNRAIMDRLDTVVGPENWKNEYAAGPDGGVLCGLSLRLDSGEWLTKWDGAKNTDVESVKGGLSGAMKRAAVQLGMGRYLYSLSVFRVDVVEKGTPRALYCPKNDKKGVPAFYWLAPQLPLSALPSVERDKILNKAQEPQQNGAAKKPAPAHSPPMDDRKPGAEIAKIATQLTSIHHVPSVTAFNRLQKQVLQKIAANEYTADEVKALEAALAKRAKELGIPDTEGADEPDRDWLTGHARELGCPEQDVDSTVTIATTKPDPAGWIATKPWLKEPATA